MIVMLKFTEGVIMKKVLLVMLLIFSFLFVSDLCAKKQSVKKEKKKINSELIEYRINQLEKENIKLKKSVEKNFYLHKNNKIKEESWNDEIINSVDKYISLRGKHIDWVLAVLAMILSVFTILLPIIFYFMQKSMKEKLEKLEKEANNSLKLIKGKVEKSGIELEKEARARLSVIDGNIERSRTEHAEIIKLKEKMEVYLEAVETLVKKAERSEFESQKSANKSKASTLFNEALRLSDDKNHEEAIIKLDEAIKLAPEDIETYNNRGIEKAELKKYDEAIKDYDKAIELDPKYRNAYYNKLLSCLFLADIENVLKNIKILKTFDFDEYIKTNLPILELIVAKDYDGARAKIKELENDGIEVDTDFEELLKMYDPTPQ